MNEKDLERIAHRLGRRAGASLDVERTSASVMRRLRSAETVGAPRWWSQPALLRMAAAITITIGAVAGGYRLLHQSSTETGAMPELAALQVLSSDELEEVLDSLTIEAPAGDLVAAGLHNMDDEQLTQLLSRMEG